MDKEKREVSSPLDLIIKQWFNRGDIQPEQLKNYKIWGEGYTVFFPELDENIPVRIFTDGLKAPCYC